MGLAKRKCVQNGSMVGRLEGPHQELRFPETPCGWNPKYPHHTHTHPTSSHLNVQLAGHFEGCGDLRRGLLVEVVC